MAATPYAAKRTPGANPYGSRCASCGKKICEGARNADIRCRNCQKLNVIRPESHTVTE